MSIETISSIIALEKAVKKLNEALRTHRMVIKNLNEVAKDHECRLDILESGHPDTDIDYGTTDDDGNITEVWFEGKRYVPEDKRDEDTTTLYADNKVVAETSKPDVMLTRIKKLNYIYNTGLISMTEYRRRLEELSLEELSLEELTHNDT